MATPFLTNQKTSRDILGPTKFSMPKVDVGENVDAWESQAQDTLMANHPWVAKVTVNVVLTTKSEEGFAVGFFHLTPRNIPAAATGEDRINVISIPIIIADFKMAPFDIYLYKDQFYPLSEERAMRLLRLPDIFQEADRDPMMMAKNLLRDTGLSSGRRDFGGMFGSGSSLSDSLKVAHAVDPSKVKALVKRIVAEGLPQVQKKVSALKRDVLAGRASDIARICERDPDMLHVMLSATRGVPRDAKVSSAPPQLTPEDAVGRLAKMAGIEVMKNDDSISTRDYWYSDPVEGKPRVSEWRTTPYHKVSSGLGQRHAAEVLVKGWTYVDLTDGRGVRGNLASVLRQLGGAEARHKVSELADPGWLHPQLAKQSSLRSGLVPSCKLLFLNDKETPGFPSKVEGYIINPARYSAMGGRFGILTTNGDVISPAKPYGGFNPSVVQLGPEPLTTIPEIKAVRRILSFEDLTPADLLPSQMAIWMEGDALVGVLFSKNMIHIDGETYYRPLSDGNSPRMASEAGTPEELFSKDGNFETMVEETRGGNTITHLPKRAKILEVVMTAEHTVESGVMLSTTRTPLQGSTNIKVSGGPRTSPIWVVAPERGPQVKVSCFMTDSGEYRMEHPVTEVISEAALGTDARSFKVALSYAGFNEEQASDIIGAIHKFSHVEFEAEMPQLGEGGQLVREALQLANTHREKRSKALRAIDTHGMLPLVKVAHAARPVGKKLSGAIMGVTVDAALSLNFLTPDTLMKFVDMRPDLESALSKICALLMASRLGLTEVPEQALETAMTALEPVLRGLRMLEMGIKEL